MMKYVKRPIFFGALLAVLAAFFVTARVSQAAPMFRELTRFRVASSSCAFGSSILSGVAAVSHKDVWAAGDAINTSNIDQTLIEHWDGSQWTIVASPDVPSMPVNLLKAAAAGSCRSMARYPIRPVLDENLLPKGTS